MVMLRDGKRITVPNMTAIRPGPVGAGGGPLPVPPPAGMLPPEDSRLWVFTAKAVQGGENFIQDDTREWFEERGRKVQITREYEDHPRWLIAGKDSVRAKMANAHIVSEIHMLARISAGLADVPSWVPARMSIKQQQADLAYRLTKASRDTFLIHGKSALETFASRAPGQFIKFVAATFIPKQIEAFVPEATEELTKQQADSILGAIADELKRRADEAKTIALTPLDYSAPTDVVDAVAGKAEELHKATGDPYIGSSVRFDAEKRIAYGLGKVRDVITDQDDWD